MSVWMYAIREFEDALDDCQEGCTIENCNDDPVQAWDEGGKAILRTCFIIMCPSIDFSGHDEQIFAFSCLGFV
jgi:hypothetical protein